MSKFELHHNGPCMLCKGADESDDFDYCRACGFTVLDFEPLEAAEDRFGKAIDKARGDRNPHTKPVVFDDRSEAKTMTRKQFIKKYEILLNAGSNKIVRASGHFWDNWPSIMSATRMISAERGDKSTFGHINLFLND